VRGNIALFSFPAIPQNIFFTAYTPQPIIFRPGAGLPCPKVELYAFYSPPLGVYLEAALNLNRLSNFISCHFSSAVVSAKMVQGWKARRTLFFRKIFYK
jgi:hypothetical protein